jgi:secretion/DNA translocation related TadE-like protein
MTVRVRDERGVGTVLGVAMIGLLVIFTLICAAVASLVITHRAAQSAADLAALAGAGSVSAGRDPCSTAADIALRNGAALTACSVSDFTVTVEVTARTPRLLWTRYDLQARSRAGPADGRVSGPGPSPRGIP